MNITPQTWLVGTVVILALLVAIFLIVYGTVNGDIQAKTDGMTLLLPILSAFGIYQIAKK